VHLTFGSSTMGGHDLRGHCCFPHNFLHTALSSRTIPRFLRYGRLAFALAVRLKGLVLLSVRYVSLPLRTSC